MTLGQQAATIAICALCTMFTRFSPFIVFSEGKKTPPFVEFVGKYLPPAVFGMLVVYCLKDVNFLASPHGLPEILAIAVTAALHLWKRQTLISIAGGTLCYMALIRIIA